MKILSKIQDFLNPWKRNVDVSKTIHNFYVEIDEFNYLDTSRLLALHITNVLARKENGILVIKIELERPGILIGKGGRGFNALHSYLEQELNCLVNIKIVESTLWNFRKY